jgi:hypothetical protein
VTVSETTLEVLEALKAADGDDRIRSTTTKICQALIEATICPALIEAEPTGVSVPLRMSAPRPGPERNGSPPADLVHHGREIWSCGAPSCAPARRS